MNKREKIFDYTEDTKMNDNSYCPVVNSIDEKPMIVETKEDQEKEKSKVGKCLCLVYISIFLIIGGIVIAGLIFESKSIGKMIKFINDMAEHYVKNENFTSYCVYFGVQILFHIFFVPGLTFFNALIGLYEPSTFKAFLIVYITSVTSCF